MPGPETSKKGALKRDTEKPPVVRGFMHKFPMAIEAVSFISVMGAEKYDLELDNTDVYLMPDATGRLLEAEGRHLVRQGLGLYDPESGKLHAAHKAWEAMATLESMLREGIPLNRPEYPTEAASGETVGDVDWASHPDTPKVSE